MGRKKKKQSKPWCWYCNREFDDEKILIQHQKAKHFKCHICHKKLYTGPGLSIHCMQVHKETIDKVPNSLPNRGNIEIEIYGMEGIPDADIKAHENSRGMEDDEDGPAMKRAKSDSPAISTPPGMAVAGPPGIMPGLPPMAIQMPGLPPGIPQLRPPFMGPGLPWGVVPVAPQPAPVQYSGRPTGPNGQPTGPAKPLFPAASGAPSSVAGPVGADFKPLSAGARPTFPAYSGERNGSDGEGGEKKPALIATTGSNSRIIHPPEDISLEERRAAMPKYNSARVADQAQMPTSSMPMPGHAMPGPGVMVAASSPVPQPGPPLMAGPMVMGGPMMPGGQMLTAGGQLIGGGAPMMAGAEPPSQMVVMSAAGPMLIQSSPATTPSSTGPMMVSAGPMLGQPMMGMPRPGLVPGIPGMPGLVQQGPPGAPMAQVHGFPGMVASQPQVMLARPPMLGIPSQPAMFGAPAMGGGGVTPVMLGGLPGLAHQPGLAPAGAAASPFGAMIGVPRFR